MTIQSDTIVAKRHATLLKSAVDRIANVQAASKDENTNVSGNTSAHATIDSVTNNLKRLATTFTTASSNIHQISTAFEAVDGEAAQEIFDSHYSDY